MDTQTKNLMFLLGAAPMALTGCGGDDLGDTVASLTAATFNPTSFTTTNAEETGSGDGDGDPTTTTTTSGDGDGDPTTTTTTTTTTGDGDGDGDGDPTTSTTTTTSTSGDGDGDGAPGDGVCTEYANLIGTCYGANYIDQAYMYCTMYEGEAYANSQACGLAFEAFLACLSGLDCAQFMDFPAHCGVEQQSYFDACP